MPQTINGEIYHDDGTYLREREHGLIYRLEENATVVVLIRHGDDWMPEERMDEPLGTRLDSYRSMPWYMGRVGYAAYDVVVPCDCPVHATHGSEGVFHAAA